MCTWRNGLVLCVITWNVRCTVYCVGLINCLLLLTRGSADPYGHAYCSDRGFVTRRKVERFELRTVQPAAYSLYRLPNLVTSEIEICSWFHESGTGWRKDCKPHAARFEPLILAGERVWWVGIYSFIQSVGILWTGDQPALPELEPSNPYNRNVLLRETARRSVPTFKICIKRRLPLEDFS
jgi:hypothetical protein